MIKAIDDPTLLDTIKALGSGEILIVEGMNADGRVDISILDKRIADNMKSMLVDFIDQSKRQQAILAKLSQ